MANFGLDLLGLADNDWNRKATAAAVPGGFSVGLFDLTFGDGIHAADEWLTTREHLGLNTPSLRAHIYWNNTHMLAPEGIIQQRAPLWNRLALKHTKTRFFLSPSCEYKSTDLRAVQRLVEIIRHQAPACTPILAPAPGSAVPAGLMTEEHGINSTCGPGQFASYDGGAGKGDGLYDIDSNQWIFTKNWRADLVLAWAPRFNLSESHNTFDPAHRTASPSPDFIRGICRLFDSPLPLPPIAPGLISFTRPLLYKNFAEDMQGPNIRDNKPLIIVDAGAPNAEIICQNGTKIGTLPIWGKPGDYPGNLTRYYSGLPGGINLMAWQIADRAVQESGSPFIKFRVGHKEYGWVNANLRAGFYQA